LIGIPIRLVVSQKTNGKVEWKFRTEDKTELLEIKNVIRKAIDFIQKDEQSRTSYTPYSLD
jgi:hypothetical protein